MAVMAEGGGPVTICRRGVPAVDLVRTEKTSSRKPKFGTLRGRIAVGDADWCKPMSAGEVEEFPGTVK